MSKKFEVIRPKSLTDSAYEDFEYLIRWVGRDGADYLMMFYDVEIRKRITGDVINREDSERIESIINESQKDYELFVDDLSRTDLNVVLEMFENKFVTRLKTDGTTERFAVDQNSFRYRLMDGRYEVEISLIGANNKVWN